MFDRLPVCSNYFFNIKSLKTFVESQLLAVPLTSFPHVNHTVGVSRWVIDKESQPYSTVLYCMYYMPGFPYLAYQSQVGLA